MSYSAISKTPPIESTSEDSEKETGSLINDSFPSPTAAQKPRQILLKQHFLSAIALTILFLWGLHVSPLNPPSIFSIESKHEVQTLREYNLTTGYKWANPDGGRWRVMFVGNGETPCPTLEAKEGDIIQLNVQNDAGTQSSIHVSGMSHKRFGYWNDGTAGLNQYPILPRGNWTSVYDTTDYWGLSWYIEHTTGTANDGLYGVVWVSPSPERPRPYSRIPGIDSVDLDRIMEAESDPKHLIIKNHWQRTSDWKLMQMRAEGTDFHCYDSLLVNGKGRSHCRHQDYLELRGSKLDSTGCIRPAGQEVQDCQPSTADYEIIETNSQPWMMLNLLNVGFEHAVKVSIDGHKMWIVANDGGFVEPKLVDVVYITNAARVTVLVKLDAEPADYAIRISSTSQVQMLQGYSILRYPTKRYPKLGEAMVIPEPLNLRHKCLLPNASINPGCIEADLNAIPPFPTTKLPAKATKTFSLSAGVQKSETETYVPEYFLNKKPWQIFRGAMTPLLFKEEPTSFENPIISGIPIGSIVDVIVQNTMNDTVSLYKHGKPSWLLGSEAFSRFEWAHVEDARKGGVDLNLENPPLVLSHDLPPLGWSVLRFKIDEQAVTSLHAAKLKYFVLGMSAPIIEGITEELPLDAPVYAKSRPHVEFEPANDGIFGK